MDSNHQKINIFRNCDYLMHSAKMMSAWTSNKKLLLRAGITIVSVGNWIAEVSLVRRNFRFKSRLSVLCFYMSWIEFRCSVPLISVSKRRNSSTISSTTAGAIIWSSRSDGKGCKSETDYWCGKLWTSAKRTTMFERTKSMKLLNCSQSSVDAVWNPTDRLLSLVK